MKIYTKGGDEGKTSFVGGERVDKDDLRIEAVGAIDELNAVIGLSISLLNGKANAKQPALRESQIGKANTVKQMLLQTQNDLFTLGSELSYFTSIAKERKQPQTTVRHIYYLENYIDRLVSELPVQTKFILPNGTQASTALHFARTTCRRTERIIVTLSRKYELNPCILKYLNRLSDLLFIMARYTNKESDLNNPLYQYFNN